MSAERARAELLKILTSQDRREVYEFAMKRSEDIRNGVDSLPSSTVHVAENPVKNDRPTWDTTWMKTAEIIAERSVDNVLKVGCVIVTDDNTQILSLGYNGDHKGGPNSRESDEPGCSGFIHAELNALIKLDYNNPKKKVVYCTHGSCRDCAKALVNGGISKLVYKTEFRDRSGIEILISAGIEVVKFAG